MRAIIQRVNSASITVNNKKVAEIDRGLLIFLGVLKSDTSAEAGYLANKIVGLRIFSDRNRKMNLCAKEVDAQFLVVSQFTLCADLIKGRRPSFDQAAPPETAEKLYLEFIRCLVQDNAPILHDIPVRNESQGHLCILLDQ